MPSGKTHIKINWVVLVLINVLIILFHQNISIENWFLFNIIFILTSYYISPDLDINSSVYKRWGLLKLIWWPYLKLMKHRQSSHSIVLGPISILVYLGVIIISGLLIINYIIPLQLNGFSTDIPLLIVICVFLITEIHIIADKIF